MTELLSPDGDIQDPYRGFIAKSRYSRWLEREGRRETWTETVDRYMSFMLTHLAHRFDHVPDTRLVEDVRSAILHHEVMPSMRAMMTAGEALERSPIAGFNCSYLPLKDPLCLDELLYILMNGTGVGYSVEKRYVDQLPVIPAVLKRTPKTRVFVEDSKEGWAHGYRALLLSLWNGWAPEWDLSAVRPAGARLKTFGGRASGPEPLAELFEFTVETFQNAAGRKLRPIEVHDLACKIASVVVVGGVRRSAMISLSDLDDQEMAAAKSGEWWTTHPHRRLANISAVYHDNLLHEDYAREWDSLVASGSGERGIFNRDAARRQAVKNGVREYDVEYGTNPCSEIILKPFSFCNLSEVVVRAEDDYETLRRKVRVAAVLGTWQSTLTDFPYLRDIWRRNARQERLLGVSLTGVYDSPILNGSLSTIVDLPELLSSLRDHVYETNAAVADELGIDVSVATTCVKPSGTVSQLVDSASGLHQRYAKYYVRRVRADKKDPLAQLMTEAGVPHEEDAFNSGTWVFSFPVKAPEDAVTREDVDAVSHLDLWLTYQRFWCEHKPSVTVSVREHEWDAVRDWVWNHLDEISGVSFLPYSEHTYVQAPYTECTKEVYEALLAQMPTLQWSDLSFYEVSDGTVGSQELACSADGGGCEAVDLVAA
ncbi:hypothetical protein ACFYP4_02775 [Streptomyces sp. NPDC005551]|uniref:hypothetical protein n=1 Tax=Streptomyces sp. NPDC005551 TaxID=3364725 RepID=UPI0036C8CDBB